MEKRTDKNAENDLMKQVKAYVLDGHFDRALEVIKSIDVNRIKVAPSLCLIGEVYMRQQMYEEAEAVFLKAYAKSPKNRRILNLLTSLYIEMGNYPEAEYYYKEFIAVASRDLNRYILRYRLDRAKGERKSVLIHTLERLKDYEYIEEWAFELARLYHEAGEDEQCIHECDEIVLWFGNGEYVNKAIELKCSITKEPLPIYLAAEKQFAKAGEDPLLGQVPDDGGFDIGIVEQGIAEEEEKKEEWQKTMASLSKSMDAQSQGQAGEPKTEDEPVSQPQSAGTDTMTKDQLFDALSSGDTRSDFWKSKERPSDIDEMAEKYADMPDEELDRDEVIDGIQEEELFNTFFGTEGDDDDDDDFEEEDIGEVPSEGLFEQAFDDDDEEDNLEQAFEDDEEDSDDQDEVISEAEQSEIEAFFGGSEDDEEADEQEVQAQTAYDEEIEVVDEDGLIMDEDDIIEERVWTAEDKDFIAGLFEKDSKTESDVLATVPNINYVKEQLSKTFTKFEETATEKFDILASYDINFVVLSTDKSLKSQIALGIAKALNTYGLCDKSKIVRASAEELNARDFSVIFDKLQGGCLIIEKADLLSEKSVSIIEWEVNKENQKTAIVLESFYDEMMEFWKKHQSLRSKFLNVINVSKYNEMELVTLAKGYIEQKKYEMAPEVALILRDYFKKCLENNQVVNYEDVMGIVDVAITNVENRNSKNLFMTVLENRYEEASMFRLLPEDFKFLQR